MEPIKNRKEADIVRKQLIEMACKTLHIDKEEAGKRIDGLLKSGIMNEGHPDDPLTRMKMDAFMQIPSEKYAHFK